MKKGSGSNAAASNREIGGYNSHRQTASSSVGLTIKARNTGAAAAADSGAATNNERTGYHQSAGNAGVSSSKPNPIKSS